MTMPQNHRRFEKRLRNEPHTRRSREIFCQRDLVLPSAETTPPLAQAIARLQTI